MSKCNSNFDCSYFNFCNEKKICEHESINLFKTKSNFIGYLLIIIITTICSISSISGGSLIIANLRFVLNFYYNEAKPICILSYFINYLINFFFTSKKQNPYKNEIKAIDYNLTIIGIPSFTFGFIFGDIFSSYDFDNYRNRIICVFTCILILIYSLTRLSYSIYYSQFNMDYGNLVFNIETNSENSIERDKRVLTDSEYIKNEIIKDNEIIQNEKIQYIFIPLCLMMLFSVLVNSKKILKYSKSYFIITGIYLIIQLIYNFLVSKLILIKYQKKLINGYPFIIKDIQYSKIFIYKFQFINLLSGLITGIASIDPGMMIISFLIRQNINLLIISSSVSLYGLTTSFFAFFYTFFSKECNFNYMVIIFICSIIGALIGNKISNFILKSNPTWIYIIVLMISLSSLIVFSLCNIILLFK